MYFGDYKNKTLTALVNFYERYYTYNYTKKRFQKIHKLLSNEVL